MSLSIDQINAIIARSMGWQQIPDGGPWYISKPGFHTFSWECPTYHRAEDHGELLRVERERLGSDRMWNLAHCRNGICEADLFLGNALPFHASGRSEDLARADCVAQALAAQHGTI